MSFASGLACANRSDSLGRCPRSIFPDTGFMTNFSTRNIREGIDGAGSCCARIADVWAAQSAGAGAATGLGNGF